MSWNAHKGSLEGWGQDFASYGARTDFILLQEAVLDDDLKEQLGVLTSSWLLAIAFQLDWKEVGILSASPIPPDSYCALREPEPLIRIPKIVLASTYPLKGLDSELLVVNVHMVNFTFGTEVLRRQLEALGETVSNHQGPAIVAGDFNTWNEGRAEAVVSAMTALGMKAVSFMPDNRVEFFHRKVDGVYYRGLEVTASSSYRVETSDHNPLEVHFRLAHKR